MNVFEGLVKERLEDGLVLSSPGLDASAEGRPRRLGGWTTCRSGWRCVRRRSCLCDELAGGRPQDLAVGGRFISPIWGISSIYHAALCKAGDDQRQHQNGTPPSEGPHGAMRYVYAGMLTAAVVLDGVRRGDEYRWNPRQGATTGRLRAVGGAPADGAWPQAGDCAALSAG